MRHDAQQDGFGDPVGLDQFDVFLATGKRLVDGCRAMKRGVRVVEHAAGGEPCVAGGRRVRDDLLGGLGGPVVSPRSSVDDTEQVPRSGKPALVIGAIECLDGAVDHLHGHAAVTDAPRRAEPELVSDERRPRRGPGVARALTGDRGLVERSLRRLEGTELDERLAVFEQQLDPYVVVDGQHTGATAEQVRCG